MKLFIGMSCAIGLCWGSLALASSSGMPVSSLKCDGGWVKVGSNKLAVVKACGKPLLQEQVNGENEHKMEGLFYNVNSKSYILYVEKGEVAQIELQYR